MELGKSAVREIEERIDESWEQTELPSAEFASTAFYLLTSVEGLMRFGGPAEWDRLKYVLRSALDLSRAKCQFEGGAMPALDWRLVDACRHVFESADGYESAKLAFQSYWVGAAACARESGVVSFRLAREEGRHEILDRLVFDAVAVSPPTDNPFPWCQARILDQATLDSCPGRVTYRFNPSIPKRLMDGLADYREYIPADWSAWELGADIVRRVLRAFAMICFYHKMAIDVIAGEYEIERAGAWDRVMRLPFSLLCSRVSKVAAVNRDDVQLLMKALVYGEGTRSPDPALQPVIPLGQQVGIPCAIVVSSNIERNLLTLQARVRADEFDRQSHKFEGRMTAEIRSILEGSGLLFATSVDSRAGEIDLLLADPETGTLLVVELKWCLPPGDWQETANRRKAVERGGVQVRQKLAACDELDLRSVLRAAFKLRERVGAVVCDGHTSFTGIAGVPCVPWSVLVRLLRDGSSVVRLAELLREEPWLPKEGVHFEVVDEQCSVGDQSFTWIGHAPTKAGIDLVRSWSSERQWKKE